MLYIQFIRDKHAEERKNCQHQEQADFLPAANVSNYTVDAFQLYTFRDDTERSLLFKVGNLLCVTGDAANQICYIIDGNDYSAAELGDQGTDRSNKRFLALSVKILVVFHCVDDGDHHDQIVGVVAEVSCHISQSHNPAFERRVGRRHQQPDQQHPSVTGKSDKKHFLHELFARRFAGEPRIDNHQHGGSCQSEGRKV